MNPAAMISIALMIFGISLIPASAQADAEDDPVLVKLMLDQLETRGSGSDNVDSWDAQAWIGKDLTKTGFDLQRYPQSDEDYRPEAAGTRSRTAPNGKYESLHVVL